MAKDDLLNDLLPSPVVLAGPPRLSFQKPVVLSFGHCAGPMQEGWEIGLYHCDSMFSEGKEESWVKLVTVGQEAPSSPILTHLDFSSCFLLTDFLSRFCLVGQARPGGGQGGEGGGAGPEGG